MHTNGQRLLNQSIAAGALLRGVLRVNRYKLATSTFSLVTDHSFEHPKSCIRSGSSEYFALGHKSQRQVFNRYQRIVVGQLVRPPMPKVCALLFDFVMQTGDFVFGLVKAMRAFLFSRQRPLSDSKFGKRTLQPARVFNERAIRQSQQSIQSHVDSNGETRLQWLRRLAVVSEKADIPTSQSLSKDDLLEHAFRNISMPLDLNEANMLDVELVVRELASVSVPILKGAKTLEGLEARKSGLFVVWVRLFQSAKEGLHGFVLATQKLLDLRCIQEPKVFGPLFSVGLKAIPERDKVERLSLRPIGFLAHIQRLIIEDTRLVAEDVEKVVLFLGWIKPKSVCPLHDYKVQS